MPITLRHITGDSSWLITLTSPLKNPSHPPFTILVDPWIEGPSPVFHPKFVINRHTVTPEISHLSQLPQVPDVLLISQSKTDHCNEATCRQLPREGIQIYAVPGADKIIRSWKHFNPKSINSFKPFASKSSGRVCRVPVYRHGRKREAENFPSSPFSTGLFETDPDVAAIIELAFLPALKPWEIPNLHIALGITYTPTQAAYSTLPPSPPLTPPTPLNFSRPRSSYNPSASTVSFVSSHVSNLSPTSSPVKTRSNGSQVNLKLPGPKNKLTESIVYSPHGVPATALTAYLHSLPLPITILLHCFVKVDNPKWLGGTVSAGAPNAFKIVEDMKDINEKFIQQLLVENDDGSDQIELQKRHKLGFKYLISTHDEEIETRGFVKYFTRKRKYEFMEIDEVLREIAGEHEDDKDVVEIIRKKEGEAQKEWYGPGGVRLLNLEVGEQAVLL